MVGIFPEKDFPSAEYEKRWNRAQTQMKAEGLDAILVSECNNFRYFSGHRSIQFKNKMRPQLFLLPAEGDPTLLLYSLEVSRAESATWIDDIRSYTDVPFPPELVVETIEDKGLAGGNIGLELGENQRLWMSIESLETIKTQLDTTEFSDAGEVINQCRMRKTELEVERIEEAVLATEAAWDLILERVEPGMHVHECEEIAWDALVEVGTEVDLPANDPGFVTVYGPMTREENVYRKGDLFYMDFGGRYEGYHADIARRATFGPPSETQKRNHEQIVNIEELVIDAIEPGGKPRDVHTLCNQELEKIGVETLPDSKRIGHGLGLNLQEPPSLNAVDTTEFQPGMVLTPEPRFVRDGVWVMVEHDVLVTEDGARCLGGEGYKELKEIDC